MLLYYRIVFMLSYIVLLYNSCVYIVILCTITICIPGDLFVISSLLVCQLI